MVDPPAGLLVLSCLVALVTSIGDLKLETVFQALLGGEVAFFYYMGLAPSCRKTHVQMMINDWKNGVI